MDGSRLAFTYGSKQVFSTSQRIGQKNEILPCDIAASRNLFQFLTVRGVHGNLFVPSFYQVIVFLGNTNLVANSSHRLVMNRNIRVGKPF